MAISMRPSDAVKGGFGIQEGRVRIVRAAYVVHQYPPKRGTDKQFDPFLAAAITFVRLNAQGKPEGDPEDSYYSLGGQSMTYYRPSTDGKKIGTADLGNNGSFIVMAPGVQAHPLDPRCGWMVFLAAAVNAGFDESKLAAGDIRVLVGLTGDVKMQKYAEIEGRSAQCLVFEKITDMGPFTALGDGKGYVREAPAESPIPGLLEDGLTLTDLRKRLFKKLVLDKVPKAEKAAIMAQLEDPEALESLAIEAGFEYAPEDQVFKL